jgi:hypothetical protein
MRKIEAHRKRAVKLRDTSQSGTGWQFSHLIARRLSSAARDAESTVTEANRGLLEGRVS